MTEGEKLAALEREFLEALRDLSQARDACWSSLRGGFTLRGERFAPLTLRAYVDLSMVCNQCLIDATEAEPLHVAAFLWRLRPQYNGGTSAGAAEHDEEIERFAVRFLGEGFDELCEEIEKYRETIFNDLDNPPSTNPDFNDLPVMSFATGLIDLFASRYGWSAEQVLDTPLHGLFQLRKCVRMREDTEYRPSKPLRAERRRMLAMVNAMAKKEAPNGGQ